MRTELVAVPEQLPKIAFRWGRNPDPRETIREQQFENERSVPFIGFLLAYFASTDSGRISNPEFVTEFREQSLEPVHRTGGFDAHAHGLLQTSVERFGLSTFVVQASFEEQLARGVLGHGNLLIARMKITTYNQHCSAPFFRASVVSATKFTRRQEPTPSTNQPYSKTITEINGALNPGTPGQFFSTQFSTDKAYAGVLDSVRKDLGRNIDFSKQSDREAIGNALIQHIRQTGGCDVNGKKQPGC